MAEKLQKEYRQLLAQARGLLGDLERAGVTHLPAPAVTGTPSGAGQAETLEDIRRDLGDCTRCRLCEKRTKIVFGVGNPDARLVFVGEAPGRDEDLKGEPFVGEAGKLLDRIIFAMGMQRSDVYICNVIKCRPPGNRDPKPEEIATCEPFLQRQLQAIRPRAIVTLGKFAAQTLLASDVPISRLRGQWSEYRGIPLMPTYHPAYLLRNPGAKRDVWEDVKQVLRLLASGPE